MKQELTKKDADLISCVRTFLEERFQNVYHQVAAGVVTDDGFMYTSVNLKSNVGRANVCAEAIALGTALNNRKKTITTVVALFKNEKQPPTIISPCGPCRELFYDFAPNIFVIIENKGQSAKYPIKMLLPYRYDTQI